MPKPIFLVKVSNLLSKERINQISEMIEKLLDSQYYVLVLACLSSQEPVFECYNVEKVEQTDIDTIREMINNLWHKS